MIKKKPTYSELALQSASSSWWYFVPVALKELGNTISIIKGKLINDEQFNQEDLPKLRKLYAQLRDLSAKNKELSNFNGVAEEKDLLKQMFTVVNSYFDKTNITAGVQKRVTRAMMGSPVATVDSYYYKVGNDKGFALLVF